MILIGGGENGRILENGEKAPYETEIIDDKYRIIFNDSNKDKKSYVIKAYWDNGFYKEKHLFNTEEFLPINDLLSKDI